MRRRLSSPVHSTRSRAHPLRGRVGSKRGAKVVLGVCCLLLPYFVGACGGSNDTPVPLSSVERAKLPRHAGVLIDSLCQPATEMPVSRRAARVQLRALLSAMKRSPEATVVVDFTFEGKPQPTRRSMTVRALAKLEAEGPESGIPSRVTCYERYRDVLRAALRRTG
jgi:hypothetical protein